ncbi:hypothetical protein KA517_01785 [Candidatus Gracilibacteria bacterium]|nr:hypothetical protein [Candidatus Gracilibacteria bacterium]
MEPLRAAPQTSDDIRARLSLRPNIPGSIRALFGSENIKNLVDLLIQGPLFDLDLLVETGEMNFEEAGRYARALPEIGDSIEKANHIATTIVDRLGPGLVRRLKNQQSGNGENIEDILKKISDLSEILTPNLHGWRSGLFLTFQQNLCGTLFAKIDGLLTNRNERLFLYHYCKELRDRYRKYSVSDFPGTSFIVADYHTTNDSLNDPLVTSSMARYLRTTGSLTAERKKAMETEIKEKLEWIDYLRQTRRVMAHTRTTPHGAVTIYRDDFEPHYEHNPTIICCCQIVFVPNTGPIIPELIRDPQSTVLAYNTRYGTFNVDIDRKGEIRFSTNLAMTYAGLVSEETYLLLRLSILSQLQAYLEAKKDDISDPFLVKPRDATRTEIETILRIDSNNGGTELKKDDTDELEEQSIPDSTPETTLSTTLVKRPRKAQRLKRNLKMAEVQRAIEHFLGPPVRTCGNHLIFRGRDGKTSPISLHRGEISTKMLAGCIKTWGISVEEFMAFV